jgi:hypothetical protein
MEYTEEEIMALNALFWHWNIYYDYITDRINWPGWTKKKLVQRWYPNHSQIQGI